MWDRDVGVRESLDVLVGFPPANARHSASGFELVESLPDSKRSNRRLYSALSATDMIKLIHDGRCSSLLAFCRSRKMFRVTTGLDGWEH